MLVKNEISKKWELQFGHFSAFIELQTAFWTGFRYRSEKHKTEKKVAPGIDINFYKIVLKS